jgi:histidine triad (HIT) family protein
MSDMLTDDCFVCRKHADPQALFGGVIYADELIFISHAQLWGDEQEHYLGHVFIETRRHVAELADLSEFEARRVGLYTCRMAEALLRTQGVEHVYSFFIGDGVPHVHVHVIGRYPGAPKEYWGPRVDEWPEAPRGGGPAIAEIAGRLRDFLHGQYNQSR